MNWRKAITELHFLGYRITLNEGRLKYAYQGNGKPTGGEIIPIIEMLKAHKEEIINDPYFLIDLTIREIDEGWTPGTLGWMKEARPSEWETMLIVEREINRLALKEDVDGLRETLRDYKKLMVSMREPKLEIRIRLETE